MVVVVLDDNDNPPTFRSSAPYTAFLREDVANDTLVYFEGEGYIFVSDADQVGCSTTMINFLDYYLLSFASFVFLLFSLLLLLLFF